MGGPGIGLFEFRKAQYRPVKVKICLCPMSLFLIDSCLMSPKPKLAHVVVSDFRIEGPISYMYTNIRSFCFFETSIV